MNLREVILNSLLEGVLLGIKIAWPFFAAGLMVMIIKLISKVLKAKKLRSCGILDIDKMSGLTFEKYLEVIFKKEGYRVVRTQYAGDYGADLIIEKEGIKTIVQAKRYKSKVGIKAVQEVVPSIRYYECDRAMVITNSFYTKQAINLARANDVELWNRNDLIEKLVKNNSKKELSESNVIVQKDNENDLKCEECTNKISEKVKKYCEDHSEKFQNKILCYKCQQKFKK
ncbi:MAG: restriction endonuclease [Peptostreptococcaceae bacterium]|jgi:restriction system protein|nr:restriction endonuclease [Peptostreptococcaceae bacterium]